MAEIDLNRKKLWIIVGVILGVVVLVALAFFALNDSFLDGDSDSKIQGPVLSEADETMFDNEVISEDETIDLGSLI